MNHQLNQLGKILTLGTIINAAIFSGCAYGKQEEILLPLNCKKPKATKCVKKAAGMWLKENELVLLDAQINKNIPILGAFEFDQNSNTVNISYNNNKDIFNYIPVTSSELITLEDETKIYVGKIRHDTEPKKVFIYLADKSVKDHNIEFQVKKMKKN